MRRWQTLTAVGLALLSVTAHGANSVASHAYDMNIGNALLRREEREKDEAGEDPATPTFAPTKHPTNAFVIHSCDPTEAGACDFEGCGDDDGVSATCIDQNCFKTTEDERCKDKADGHEITETTPNAFCSGKKMVTFCPPATCKDIALPYDETDENTPETCQEMIKIDAQFCTKDSMQDMVALFCRKSCNLCDKEVKEDVKKDDEASNVTAPPTEEEEGGEATEEEEKPPESNNTMMILAVVVIIILVICIGGAVTVTSKSAPPPEPAAEEAKEEEGEAEGEAEEEGEAAAEEGEAAPEEGAEEAAEAAPEEEQPPS